jgi:hypothetical protein
MKHGRGSGIRAHHCSACLVVDRMRNARDDITLT